MCVWGKFLRPNVMFGLRENPLFKIEVIVLPTALLLIDLVQLRRLRDSEYQKDMIDFYGRFGD